MQKFLVLFQTIRWNGRFCFWSIINKRSTHLANFLYQNFCVTYVNSFSCNAYNFNNLTHSDLLTCHGFFHLKLSPFLDDLSCASLYTTMFSYPSYIYCCIWRCGLWRFGCLRLSKVLFTIWIISAGIKLFKNKYLMTARIWIFSFFKKAKVFFSSLDSCHKTNWRICLKFCILKFKE